MKDLKESLEEFIFGNTGAGKKSPQGPCNNNKEKKIILTILTVSF